MKDLPCGLYELLHTLSLEKKIEQLELQDRTRWEPIDEQRLFHAVALPLAKELTRQLQEQLKSGKGSLSRQLTTWIRNPSLLADILFTSMPLEAEILTQIAPQPPEPEVRNRPDTPLSESALLTGASRSPTLHSQMEKELASCDRADWLVSFIKFSGIRRLFPSLQAFTRTPAPDGGPRLRIATTAYMGATDIKAVEMLLDLPHTEVRVSLDTHRTRLHAKAYLFHRATEFGSAYIGSANISSSALSDGLEWTAKISQYEIPHLWDYASAAFLSHWEDQRDFVPCTNASIHEFSRALKQEQSSRNRGAESLQFFNLRPYSFQQVILDDIAAERRAGKHRHIVVAATGTGKTMIAAFDYKACCSDGAVRPRLLFLAHREEILRQALQTFRQVLGDENFGEILAGGSHPEQIDHLFSTVHSWHSRKFSSLRADYYGYVVLDEAHHAQARTYRSLVSRIQPDVLLGLTATPERSDGQDIREIFGCAYTHQLRLAEAVDRALLCPFHYYGIPDHADIDFSSLNWRRGRYDTVQLQRLLETHDRRAQWVFSQTVQYIPDTSRVRGLGFCVSIQHARHMADSFNRGGIASMVLTGDSPREERRTAHRTFRDGKVKFIFSVDLYNEGLDLPSVNTVLFLRPTESLTLFLQQLGRGLRLFREKPHLTVLDFIAPQHDQFDMISRYRALSGRPELRIDTQIAGGMPFVPAGCFVHLERKAQKHILDHISRSAVKLRGRQFLQQLSLLSSQLEDKPDLQQLIDYFHLSSPDPIYRQGLPSRLLQHLADGSEIQDPCRLAAGCRRLLTVTDTRLLSKFLEHSCSGLEYELICSVLWGPGRPRGTTVQQAYRYFQEHPGIRQDISELLAWMIRNTPPTAEHALPLSGPLNLHASYTREQILTACGRGSFDQPFFTQSGVVHIPEHRTDLFFADIQKSDADFSPSTMYRDYAVTEHLFHWQSQSTTGAETPTAQRYISHEQLGYTPLLFIRERRTLSNGVTASYFYAGELRYRSHEGSHPVSFLWELKHPLPERILQWARRAAG